MGKPGDFVVSPAPNVARASLAGSFADAPIIEFSQERQVIAVSTAGSPVAFAAVVDSIRETHLQDGFLGILRSFSDA